MFCISLALILPAIVYGIGQPHYECGENGRFEYCIDDIPGCIVGCHCHPGYYFDTETKICEPNAKLVHEYRRLYSGVGPTRVPGVVLPMNELDLEPTPTTTNPLELHVENMTKETDDLGDWLYNQFFKTIESQVINSTDGKETPIPETRRSNYDTKSKKILKKKKSKLSKKGKRKDLRRQLLRITEDDSLFDSSSESSDDSSDDSDSSSSDSSSDTSSDGEYTKPKNNSKHNHGDKEHGHRKILYMNKIPKPPLPSFIFLPNMETPFFSPIGLAPPPIPMYPMIPVPPVPMPPMFPPPPPLPMMTACPSSTPEKKEVDDNGTTTTTTITTTTTTTTPSSTKSDDEYYYRAGAHKRSQKKKMLQKLQQMKSAMQMRKKTPQPPESENNNDDTTYVEERFRTDSLPPPPTLRQPPPENVDFKYLAQLIHKMDNKTVNKKPITNYDPNAPQRRFAGDLVDDFYSPPPDNSINFARTQFDHSRHLETPDESYYTKLGHQIASLIRRIDATGEQRVNIEIERQKAIQPAKDFKPSSRFDQSFMMESNAPRSYWERSVRSLLNQLQTNDDYYSLKTHEDNLFNLERKVQNFATTTPSLSLDDLENVVALIDKTKSNLEKLTEVAETTTKANDVSLNINLLPRPNEHLLLDQKNENGLSRSMSNLYVPKVVNYSNGTNHYIIENNAQNNLRGALLHNFQPVPKVDFQRSFNGNDSPHQFDIKSMSAFDVQSLVKLGHNHNLRTLPKHTPILRNVTLSRHQIANLQRIVDAKMDQVANKRNMLPNVPWLAPKLANILKRPEIYRKSENVDYLHKPLNLKITPRNHNYQSRKYYADGNNRYVHHKKTLSMKLPLPAHRSSQPSAFFHHEMQHFDAFEK